jgi:hypothetical protein
MTYNIAASTVRRHERVLISLLDGKTVIVSPPQGTTIHIYAYQLREALKSARQLKIDPYYRLDYSFSPRPSEGVVICKPRLSSEPTILAQFDERSVFPDVLDEFDVASTITSNPRDEYIFPSFNGDMASVYGFAEGMMFEVSSTEPLTMRAVQ